jgi:hypothetical protein
MEDEVIVAEEPDKCSCGNDAEEEHTCPYAEELHGDETLCTCCYECQHQCAMDI